jgi:hypothetical protein
VARAERHGKTDAVKYVGVDKHGIEKRPISLVHRAPAEKGACLSPGRHSIMGDTMPNPTVFDHDDDQLKLEMRAMAELLLDIYEYRLASKGRLERDHEAEVLDGDGCDRTMEERSTVKSNNKH